MLYTFPLPTWFESGTTSYLILLASMWAMTLAIPISVAGFCIYDPRSRKIRMLAETLWVLASILLFSFIAQIFPSTIVRDVPIYLVMAFLWVLLFLPIPAAIAAFTEPVSRVDTSNSFAGRFTAGCAIPLIILMLLFVLPGSGGISEGYRFSTCKHNLKQIGLAFHNYYDLHEKFPDSQFLSSDSPARSWRVQMLPFLDQEQLFRSYDSTNSWNSASNLSIAQHKTLTYFCPSVPAIHQRDTQGRWYTGYATVNGPGTAFPDGKGLALKEIPDGSSNTVLIAEACGQQIVWTEPKDIETTDAKVGINLPGNKPHQSSSIWSSYHKGQAFTLFGDGSVRALKADTDPQVLRAITTANGGEPYADF